GFWRQLVVDRKSISNWPNTAVESARGAKERLACVTDDLRGSQRGQTIPDDGPPVGLSLVPKERATVIGDLEGDPHAKEYLLHNISSAVCRHPRRPRAAKERGECRRRRAGHEELRRQGARAGETLPSGSGGAATGD